MIVSHVLTASVYAQNWQISAETWASPRSGLRLLEINPLSETVSAMNELPHSTLLVAFPATESGTLWANELRDWLVALGVPSTRIQLKENPADDLSLKLSLFK